MPRKTDSGNARDWLGFVKSDLAAVSLLARHEVAYHVCRSKLAEAFEKTLKADLIARGWRLEKVHDLQKLCDYLAVRDSDTAEKLQPLVDKLAEAYTVDRYPGFDVEDPDWPELRKQLKVVRQHARAVTAFLSKR